MAEFKDRFTQAVAGAAELARNRTTLRLECPDHHLAMVEDPADAGYFQCPHTYGPAHPEQRCLRGVLIHVEVDDGRGS